MKTAVGMWIALTLSSSTFGCGSEAPSEQSGSDAGGASAEPTGVTSGSMSGSTSATGASTAGATGGAGPSSGAGGGQGAAGGGSPTTPLFRMDCEDAPLDCGWGFVPEPSPYYTLTHVEDGGPAGQDVVEFDHTPQPSGTGQVQYYNGWSKVLDSPPPQGTTLYFRFWFKPLTPIDWTGTGGVWTDKFIILGDGTASTTRVICNLRDDYGLGGGQNMAINCARNIDGEPSLAQGAALSPDQWSYVQIEVRSSSTSTAEDARIAMWFNDNDYAAPTSQSTGGFLLESWGWWNFTLGFFANTAVAEGGSVRYQLGGFELDDEFDPSWSP